MRTTRFESIGSYLPSEELSTETLLSRLHSERQLDLARITGINKRRVYDSRPQSYEDSFALAAKAAADCLEHSTYAAGDLGAVISTSITRTVDNGRKFALEPSFARMLGTTIGADSALHFDVGNACAGMVTGVYVLDRMIRAGVIDNGMVVSGEQITPIAETALREISRPYDRQFASLTVGDGAAAVIVDGRGDDDDRIDYVGIMTASIGAEYCFGMPSDRSQGVAMYTDNRAMHSESRYMLGITRMRDFLRETGRDWKSENFDFWIHHQFSLPAIEYITKLAEREFGVDMPQTLNVLEEYGNTASTSHFIVLHEHLKSGTIHPGAKVLLVPSASGMVYGYLSTTLTALGR
jgi:3-oxoacyl-[acyl-carrier-protein] synthase-3